MVEAPPERVEEAAGAQRLGPLLMATKGSNPFANFVFALVVAALGFGAVLVAGSLGLGFLRRLLLLALAMSLLWLFYAVVALLTGFRRFFLYAGGLVRWQNGRVRVLRWDEVTGVQRTRAFGRRSGYQLTAARGRPVVLEAVEGNEHGDRMARCFEDAIAAAGITLAG